MDLNIILEKISFTCRGEKLAVTRMLNPWLLHPTIFRLHPLSTLESFISKMIKKHIGNAIRSNTEKKGNHGSMNEFLLADGVPHDGVLEETATIFGAVGQPHQWNGVRVDIKHNFVFKSAGL